MYFLFKHLNKKFIIEFPESFSDQLAISLFLDKEELEEHIRDELPLPTLKISELGGNNEFVFSSKTDGNCIFILKNDSYRRINFSEIMWIEASRSYSYIHVADQQPFVVTFPLSEVEKKLPQSQFLRIHRSYIINLDYVDAFVGSELRIGDKSFPVSKTYHKKVFGHFPVLGGNKDKKKNVENQ